MRVVALTIVGLVVCGVSTALAQDRQFGVKAGVNAATLTSSAETQGSYDGTRVGLTVGAFAVLPLTGPLKVQIEGLFSQKGASLALADENVTATLEFDYLDFPVLARFDGPTAGGARLHFLAGPSVSYRLAANSRLSDTGSDFAAGFVDNIEDDVSRFDLGLVVGAGAEVGRRLVVDVRYAWGLNNVFKDDLEGGDVKHRVLSVTAGIRF